MKKSVNTKEVIRVAIYIRVSTEEQARHGYSLQSQKERLIDYCKENKYKIIDYYADEGKSARCKLSSRKDLLRLIEDAKEHKFDRIVFWRLDRWFRNVKDYYKIQDILDKCKIDWECSDEEFDTYSSNGRLHLNIKLSIAQNESDQTGDRIKFNFQNMIKNKRAIQGSHCMPLGYKVAGEEKNKHVIIDEEKKDIVIDMFEHFETYCSIRKTLNYINNKYDLKILYDSMTNYFKNELYCGKYKEIENYCEPYITYDQFLKNRERIKNNTKVNNRKYEYIFSGLIKCPYCGCNYSGFNIKSTKKKYNKYYLYPAYRCNKAYNSHLCENKKVVIENSLESYLLENIIPKLKEYIVSLEEVKSSHQKNNKQYKNIEAKLDRLNDLYIEGKLTKEKYDIEYEKINKLIAENKKEQQTTKDLTIYKDLINSNGLELYHKLNSEGKRAFWKKYIDYIEVDKEHKYIVHFK